MTTTQGLLGTSAARCDDPGFAGLAVNLAPEREGIAARGLLADRDQPLDQAGFARRYVGWSLPPTSSTGFTADRSAIAFEARGREGMGSRGRGRVGVLVAAALLAGVAVVVAVALVGVRGGVSSARSSARASAASGFARLPAPLRGLVSGTLGHSERAFWVRRAGAGFALVNGAQGFSARFSDSGVRVDARGGRLALSLAGVGYGSSLRPLGSRAPSADENRVSYADGSLTQWFENGPLGLEQGFTLRAPPAGAARGPVTIALRVAGSLRARLVGGGGAVDFIAPGGGVVFRYVGLRAVDASGRALHAWLAVTGGGLLVRVDARGARYPLRIDPFVQQGSTLVGTGAVGDAQQGDSVALSSDGNTALVGGPLDNGGVGAVWVFTRSGTTWTQQGPKLVGTGAAGDAGQGSSVALSSDGNTALVGGDNDDGGGVNTHGVGAAWVFTRSGTTWTQQGAKLAGTGAVGDAAQGVSVALSGDGNTALVGGSYDDGAGAVWVFTRSGTTWTQQGSKLVATGGGGDFGNSVALSSDGDTALVGGPIGSAVGAAWVFTRSGTTWTQQGPMLVGTGAVGRAYQGQSVALSGDGNTALVGGYGDNLFVGAAWVFTRSGTTWTQQGPKLVGTGAAGDADQGKSVALSDDGNTALVGGDGNIATGEGVEAAWVFTRSGTTWTQQGPKLVGTGAVGHAYQGWSVALSGDGNTALVGGPGDNEFAGAAWVFVTQLPPPLAGSLTLPGAINSSGHQTVSLTNANAYSVIASLQETVKLTGGAVIATATNDPRTTTITIASASKTLRAHKTVKLKLKLSKQALKLLRKYHRMKVTLRLTLSASGRPSTIVKKTIVLRA